MEDETREEVRSPNTRPLRDVPEKELAREISRINKRMRLVSRLPWLSKLPWLDKGRLNNTLYPYVAEYNIRKPGYDYPVPGEISDDSDLNSGIRNRNDNPLNTHNQDSDN